MGAPLNPAFVKAKARSGQFSEHLQKMLPETQKDEILVGVGNKDKAMIGSDEIALPCVLEIFPLPFIACTELQDELQKIFDQSRANAASCLHSGTECTQQKMVCAEKKIEVFASPSPCRAYECPYFSPGDSEGMLSLVMKATGLSDRLISYAVTGVGTYAEFFRDNMTIQQRMDAVSRIWDMNSDLDIYAESVRKNVKGLLGTLGLQQETETPTPLEMKSEESTKTSNGQKSQKSSANAG